MKVCFINPPFKAEYGKFSRESRSPSIGHSGVLYYPLWLIYAACVAEQNGFDVVFIDAPAKRMDREQTLERIRNEASDAALFVFDTSTPSIYSDVRFAETLRSGGFRNQTYSGHDFMRPSREKPEHFRGFLFVFRLSEDPAVTDDDGVRADHEKRLRRRSAGDGRGFRETAGFRAFLPELFKHFVRFVGSKRLHDAPGFGLFREFLVGSRTDLEGKPRA